MGEGPGNAWGSWSMYRIISLARVCSGCHLPLEFRGAEALGIVQECWPQGPHSQIRQHAMGFRSTSYSKSWNEGG